MKKTAILFFLVLSIISCGPKRMKCYGKRCVETSVKKEVTISTKVNS
ncbi:hypothetical protein [Flavobacterium sp.]|nr:hypothetical protein [Flavobacterium sp.]